MDCSDDTTKSNIVSTARPPCVEFLCTFAEADTITLHDRIRAYATHSAVSTGRGQPASVSGVESAGYHCKGKEDDREKGEARQSLEEKTKVHRLSSTKRSVYDAFAYVNRIPERAEKDETARDVAGRIFGRLANQEGRILLKLPPGMNRESYLAFKTFFRYEGKAKVGNCAACHTLAEFSDLKAHVVTKGGSPKPTLSLRNLKNRKVDIRKAIMGKISASSQKRSGEADDIDEAYAKMDISKKDVPGLVAFLNLLNDVSDSKFRSLILNVKLLDTSKDIAGVSAAGR